MHVLKLISSLFVASTARTKTILNNETVDIMSISLRRDGPTVTVKGPRATLQTDINHIIVDLGLLGKKKKRL